MNSKQYEELCKLYVSRKLGINVDLVQSGLVQNPSRPEMPTYSHQIDLYWEMEDPIAKYLCIANAKWRGHSKIKQPDVLLLQQVRQKVSAHKALMITNAGFTSGAVAAAYDEGIGLHLVAPGFDSALLPIDGQELIRCTLVNLERSGVQLFRSDIVHKAHDVTRCDDVQSDDKTGHVERWLTRQLQKRLDYLRYVSTQGYSVESTEISSLEAEIAERIRLFGT